MHYGNILSVQRSATKVLSSDIDAHDLRNEVTKGYLGESHDTIASLHATSHDLGPILQTAETRVITIK